jgi:membrane-bound lytic murein transglycosylase B
MTTTRCLVIGIGLLIAGCTTSFANDKATPDDLRAFAERMSDRHGMDADQVMGWLQASKYQQKIIDAITSPAESLPWHRYRGIFVKPGRIKGGARFWRKHAELLERAEARYGIPPEVIVAIIAVETRFGRYSGGHRVIDALRTLAFSYPKRAGFFRSELEAYLLLAEEQGFDPLEPKGSYAGAMGMPQFIASSYRAYAVDFNGNGTTDLWDETADAVGSVANYLAEHGWREGEPVVARATVTGDGWKDYDTSGLKPDTTVGKLRAAGVKLEADYPDDSAARLLALDGDDGTEFWVARRNFYVITRYNHSALYSLAVHQLGEAIRERFEDR